MATAIGSWAASAIYSAWGDVVYLGVTAAVYAAEIYAVSVLPQQLAAKAAPDGGIGARDVVVGNAKVPQTIVYGEAWVGGALLYCNSRHDAGSKDNFTFYRKIAHTAHQVNAITDLMLDDDVVTDASHIDWGAGHITAGKYGLSRSGIYAVDVEKTLGTGTETQSPLLSSAFPVDYDGSGNYTTPGWSTTTAAFRYFSKTAKTAEGIFYSGPPQRQLARIQGYKVYDPRDDSTFPGGSGSQRLATPSTWVYSTNPALQAVHYMMIYMGVAGARIDWTWIAAQADIADDLVAIPTAATQKRFTGNGVVSLGNSHLENLNAILSSMLGALSKPSGLWRVNAAAYQTPDVAIVDADIIGDPQLKGGFGLADRYNSVTAVYIDPNAFAQEVDSIEVSDATFISNRDNGFPLPTTLAAPFTNSETQAQRLAYMHLAQSDRQKIFTINVKYIGLAVTIGTRVSVTFGKFSWNTKPFRCINWKPGDNAPFELTLREDDSAVWDDPPEAAYSTRDAQGVVTEGTVEIPTPTAGAANGETTVVNANFEIGGDLFYWNIEQGTWSLGANPHQGTYTAACTGTTNGILSNYIRFPCDAGTRVTWGGWVTTDSAYVANTAGAYFAAQYRDSSGALISSENTSTIAAASHGYSQLRITGIAPANTHWVTLACISEQSHGNVYFDDTFMMVQTGARLGEDIIDGSGNVIDDDGALNSAVVVAKGGDYTWTSDGSGAWPAGNPTHDITITFFRNGSSIGTHVVRGTLTTSTGNIAVASQSTTGEASTYSESGDGTHYAVGTAVHNASHQGAAAIFTAIEISGGGSVGK